MFKSPLLLLLFSVCFVHGNVTLTSTHKLIQGTYLDTEFMTKSKQDLSSDYGCKNCLECPKDCSECSKPFDCADVLRAGHKKSGVYKIWLMSRVTDLKPLRVYCDMDTDGGGWTVIQRRGDFGSPKGYFSRDYESYLKGFGEVEKDFWLGNEKIDALTNLKSSSVRFDLMDVEKNRRYAHYEYFWLIESNKLLIYNYSGNAGDAMEYHHRQLFSTKKEWWNVYNCATDTNGGWWYTTNHDTRKWGCYLSNLNGEYYKGKYDGNVTSFDGITWVPWKGRNESLMWTEIKVRPNDFRASLEL